MKVSKSAWIIHGFALLHALTAVVCRLVGVDDSLVLTLMTMLMTVWLCLVGGYGTEISCACVILANVVGFLLGTGGARLLGLMNASYLVTYPISTFLTTEILGWGIVLLTRLFHAPDERPAWQTSVKWLTVAFLVIIVLRFGYVESFSYFYGSSEVFLDTLVHLLSNIPALLVLLCFDIIYIRVVRRWHGKNTKVYKVLIFIVYNLAITALVTAMDVYDFPFNRRRVFDMREIAGTFTLALIIQLTVYCVVYMVNYAMSADRARDEARIKAQEAQFQYFKLKQQISPHFFFNSLNSLDGLVCENRTGLASEYIHKLAGIYRYMLGRGEEELVRVRDEMTFVDMYVAMMRLRFGEGLVVRQEIGEEAMGRMVVPCSVQLLIENVVKHNVVSEEEPVTVEIVASGDSLTVRNPLRPKLTPAAGGSGHGLKYIVSIYEHLCDRPVVVSRTGTEYIVSLPLI